MAPLQNLAEYVITMRTDTTLAFVSYELIQARD